MIEYKCLDDNSWKQFGHNLLSKSSKLLNEQKLFLQAVKDGRASFLDYIKTHLPSYFDTKLDNKKSISFDYKFSEREFCNPPKNTQQVIWDAFKDVPDKISYHNNFWGYIIIDMIANGSIEPKYLAASGYNEGKFDIDSSIRDKGKVDPCVRRILRSMCHPGPRGRKDVIFNDCYLSKTYFQWHWAHKVHKEYEEIGLSFQKILEVLEKSYYSEFAGKMHASYSYISSIKVLGGLLLYLVNFSAGKDSDRKDLSGKKLRKIINRVAYLSAWKAIEIQEPEANQQDIQNIAQYIPD